MCCGASSTSPSDTCWSAMSAILICVPPMTRSHSDWAFFCSASSLRGCLADFTAATHPFKGEQALERYVPFAGRIQLPDLGGGSAGVQCGIVDAAHRAGLDRPHRTDA